MDLKKAVYTEIVKGIINGDFPPGHRLVEEELAQLFSTSRTPVREVLLSLQKDGLVERAPGRGARVASFSPDDVEEIYEIRKALECCSVRKAVQAVSLNHLMAVKRRLEKAIRRNGSKAHREHMELDNELHELIVNASGNGRLISYMEKIAFLVNSLRQVSYRDDAHARQVGEQHLAIVLALLRRDGEEAERLLGDHIDQGCRNTIERFFVGRDRAGIAVRSAEAR